MELFPDKEGGGGGVSSAAACHDPFGPLQSQSIEIAQYFLMAGHQEGKCL
jgi:hypothetical protein